MKLRILAPPTWNVSKALYQWSNRLRIPLAGIRPITSAIIIGNGVADAVIYLILAHRLNGKSIVGITTAWREESSIETTLEIIRGRRVSKILIALDQEEEQELNNFWKNIEKAFNNHGIEFRLNESNDRIRVYTCVHGDMEFTTIIAVNGVDNPHYSRHSIEDHLLEALKTWCKDENILKLLSKTSKPLDPKKLWNEINQEYRNIHYRTYQEITTMQIKLLEQIFPQQIKALNYLA